MTKGHEILIGVGVAGVLGFVAWNMFRTTPLVVNSLTKATNPGGDATLATVTNSAPITGSNPVPSPIVKDPNTWVLGIDGNGVNLGPVEIDSMGNYLTSASKGPATSTRSGRGHF